MFHELSIHWPFVYSDPVNCVCTTTAYPVAHVAHIAHVNPLSPFVPFVPLIPFAHVTQFAPVAHVAHWTFPHVHIPVPVLHE
jgi:hypothetical protein